MLQGGPVGGIVSTQAGSPSQGQSEVSHPAPDQPSAQAHWLGSESSQLKWASTWQAAELKANAKLLEEIGCFSLVLEKVPA